MVRVEVRDKRNQKFLSRELQTLNLKKMVRSDGLEPSQGCPHKHLKLACLPFHHDREIQIKDVWSRIIFRILGAARRRPGPESAPVPPLERQEQEPR